MTTHAPGAATSAELDAARLILARIGLSPADLLATPQVWPPVPTFAEYILFVSTAVTDGTRPVYGSYWNRILEHWGTGSSTNRHPRRSSSWSSTSRSPWSPGATHAAGAVRAST